ncbi:MAG: hypothetical protein ACR2QG_02180, partial [Gammaproteobacteria bacterium]
MAADLHHDKDLESMSNNGSTDSNTHKSTLGAIRVSGAERNDFLQGQLTQDMQSLQPGKAMLAGWANAKGRLHCVTWVLDWQNSTWLVMPAELCVAVAQRLGMFVLRADARVEVSDLPVMPASREAAMALIKPEDSSASDCFYNENYLYFEPSGGLGLILGKSPDDTDMTNWRLGCIRAGVPSVWA